DMDSMCPSVSTVDVRMITDCNPRHSSMRRQRRFHAVGRKWHFPNSCACRIEDRVADRCGSQCDRRLSRAGCLRCWPVDENALDDWHINAKRQRVVTLPVGGGHLTIVPGDFLPECAARSLQYSALDLIAQALRVGNRSTIDGDS